MLVGVKLLYAQEDTRLASAQNCHKRDHDNAQKYLLDFAPRKPFYVHKPTVTAFSTKNVEKISKTTNNVYANENGGFPFDHG